ncbi:MAG TPA: ribonuclease HI family protein [Ktedonobacterales bacterium]
MAGNDRLEPRQLWASEPADSEQRAATADGAATGDAEDIGQFDGSADPNPGGRMGMGWHLSLRNSVQYLGADEKPPAPDNTNNRAEYLALISLLDEYARASGQGPLLVRGDSQLVIMQMSGKWRVRNPALQGLYDRARRAAQAIPAGVRFEWVPRSLNAQADRLASGKLGVASGAAPSEKQQLTYAQSPAQAVTAPLAAQIARLNGKESVSFKELLALRVGGRDRCSEMRWSELREAAGPGAVRACAEAFPKDERGQASALRWALRGLAVEHAIKKAQADAQVAATRQAREAKST